MMRRALQTVPKPPLAYMLAVGSCIPDEFVEPRCETQNRRLSLTRKAPSKRHGRVLMGDICGAIVWEVA
eukprot:692036-Amphidinium_carterae.1